jgi:hypothetical protein
MRNKLSRFPMQEEALVEGEEDHLLEVVGEENKAKNMLNVSKASDFSFIK